MLTITIPGLEYYDEGKNEFIMTSTVTIDIEHSLASISKWESRWKIPFLSRDKKTAEQSIDYIKCMTLNKDVDPDVYRRIDNRIISQVASYIDDSMTATWFKDDKAHRSREIITSERIYYWMIDNDIPFECENWHLNRLLTLIRVCNLEKQRKNSKKMSKKEIYSSNRALNEARRAQLNTRG